MAKKIKKTDIKTVQIEIESKPIAAAGPLKPTFQLNDPDCRYYVGDCRELLPRIPEVKRSEVDLVFADPPFNWNRAYDKWDDAMPEKEYVQFTYDWLDLCIGALKPTGSLWVNIPDDWAAEIVVHLKQRGLAMVNWCIWHYRFGQNNTGRFISSKVHVLYFCKGGIRTWNPDPILELSDRATTYFDPRTLDKKEGTPGKRLPMDVWYGQYWGRIQGNNKERRANHDNQLPEVYLDRVIKCSSNEGDLVLDPFIGSGTTPLMARHNKRRFVGTEFSINNATSAFERLKIGPIPRDNAAEQSSAIFAPRKTGHKTRAKFGKIEQATVFDP
jgi:site-specific DNA-methyltransferase (adenine-specific)